MILNRKKIYVYPADVQGCGYFRLIWAANELITRGHNVEICLPGERDYFMGQLNADRTKLMSVSYPRDADLIVMQRVTHRFLADAIAMIRSEGVPVVMDLDDDLSAIHPTNPAWAMLHPKNGATADHSWLNVVKAAKNTTLMTVSTPALAQRYKGVHGARVLYNRVPDHYLKIPRFDNDTIAWGGSALTHPDDCAEASVALSRLISEGASFRVIGPVDGARHAFGLADEPAHTGSLEFAAWPDAFATVGIGIAPLADTRFNEAKSWLKPLEMSALGIPWVASDRTEYARLAKMPKDGPPLGFVARRPRDWYKALRRLVDDKSLRQEMSAYAREYVADMTYSRHASDWLDVWEEAMSLG